MMWAGLRSWLRPRYRRRGRVGPYKKTDCIISKQASTEFSGRFNQRPLDTAVQMEQMARGLTNKRLRYTDLIGE